MRKYFLTTIAIGLMFSLSACSTNSQDAQAAQNSQVQQIRACTQGDQHPWCMQMAQTRPLGAAPYGLENSQPTNPEMDPDRPQYPINPALQLINRGPIMMGGMR
jgi:hypothetical protein